MSARRQARAEGTSAVPTASHGEPLAVLRDQSAPVWHDRDAFHAFMAEQGWTLPGIERLGGGTSPGNRRLRASVAWAIENGITAYGSGADLHRLRGMGLIA